MNSAKLFMVVKILVAAILFAGTATFAQTDSTGDVGRKVKTKVAPAYPDLAKRLNVVGKVKLQVVISQDGRVISTTAVGGNPILVQACDEAVRKWKFQPGVEETTQIVEFEFRDLH
jgi:TonB family protein